MPKKQKLPTKLANPLKSLLKEVENLQELAEPIAPKLNFPLDGRLVGDIGELLAAMKLGITIQNRQKTGFDGTDIQGRNVEIKTTFKDSFAFRKIAEQVICIKLHGSTHWEIIYDGPGEKLLPLFPENAWKGKCEISHETPASLKSQRQLDVSKLQSVR